MAEALKPLDQAALDALTLSSAEARAAYEEMRDRLTGNRAAADASDGSFAETGQK